MEVCLVACTCLNLNLENFAETRLNRQQRCMSFFRYESTVSKVKFNDESFMF
jgi:hypothetical protein